MLALMVARHAGALVRAPLTLANRTSHNLVAPHGSSTAAIHADNVPNEWAFSTENDVSPPISLSTTYECPKPGEGGHVYHRISNPTRERCEALLGAVEGTPDATAHAVLYASGLAATFGALSRLLPRRIAISGGYHGTHLVIDQLSRISGGTRCQKIPLPPPDVAAAALQPGDLIFLETPRNPDCIVADVAAYVEAARAVGDVSVVVDGTFACVPRRFDRSLIASISTHSMEL